MRSHSPTNAVDLNNAADCRTIDALFAQLLAADRTSSEFHRLWRIIDAYLTQAVTDERTIAGG